MTMPKPYPPEIQEIARFLYPHMLMTTETAWWKRIPYIEGKNKTVKYQYDKKGNLIQETSL